MSDRASLDWVRARRRLRDAVLLPVALVVILVEDVVWQGSLALLSRVSRLPFMQATRRALSRLSGWAALPLFLIPEAAGKVGELWAALLLVHGHVVSAVMAYALVRLVATLIAVFIWQACSVALLRLAWFARIIGWIEMARDWALARIAPLRAVVRRLTSRGGGRIWRRVAILRHWITTRR